VITLPKKVLLNALLLTKIRPKFPQSRLFGKFAQMTNSDVSRTSVRKDYRMRGSLSGGRGYPEGIDAFRPSRIGKKLAENSGRKLVGR
jgi:hypothetical protein